MGIIKTKTTRRRWWGVIERGEIIRQCRQKEKEERLVKARSRREKKRRYQKLYQGE